MDKETLLQKIQSVKLCLMAHPDNEQDSEFEDRISDLQEIEDSLGEQPIHSVDEASNNYVKEHGLSGSEWNQAKLGFMAGADYAYKTFNKFNVDKSACESVLPWTKWHDIEEEPVSELTKHIMEVWSDEVEQQPVREKTLTDLAEHLEAMKDDSGRDGCTYGDTDYDSQSVCYGYNTALDNAASIIRKYASKTKAVDPQQGWIDVNDRLPEFDGLVIWRGMTTWNTRNPIRVFSDEMSRDQETLEYGHQVYLLKNESDYIVSQHPNIEEISDQFITHWMPLPEPPTKTKNQ